MSAAYTPAAVHSQVGDMFGDLSVSSAPAPASSSQPSAFGFLDADPAPPAQVAHRVAAPAPAAPSSFDFLSDAAPNPQANPSPSAFNFLDTPAPAPQAAPTSSAFNFLDSAPPAPAPAASSAFTFMSNATPAPAPAPRPPRRWQRPVEQEFLLQSCARWSDGARENAGQLLRVLAVHDRAPRLQCF